MVVIHNASVDECVTRGFSAVKVLIAQAVERIRLPSMSENRRIRIFVSSTFRDMGAERDQLMTHTWPELRRYCLERQAEFIEVDLRWGIAEEQSKRKETLKICIDEIRACRPFFVGLLGERYGYTPNDEAFTADLLEEQPWLSNLRGRSVTELEIVHGVLREENMHQRAFFYFRDPNSVNRQAAFTSESPEAKAKLESLKTSIRSAQAEEICRLRENYFDPRQLADWVLEDLKVAINAEFPKESVPDPLMREARDHDAFAEIRRRVYIRRPEYFDALDRHASADDGPLVLLGDSGSGKSALLANWLKQWRKAHPSDFIFQHHIGSTPDSAEHKRLIMRLVAEIKRWTDDPKDLPRSNEEMARSLPVWLAKARARAAHRGARFILVLDAVNQLEDREHARKLGWLPEQVFSGPVRLIASTLPGEALDAVNQRGWKCLRIEALTLAERARMIDQYLARFGKKLDEHRVERLSAAPASANPLYLKILLDELRVTGTHARLDERLDEYLAASDATSLLKIVLSRYQRDYERDRPGLVGDALGLIWAARRGLSEAELLRLLKSDHLPQLPAAVWSPLRAALEDCMVDRSGILNFAHDFLRTAVEKAFVPNEERRNELRSRLADDFEKQPVTARRSDELPWLLSTLSLWERLANDLKGRLSLPLTWDLDNFDVKKYWASIEKSSGLRMVQVYQQAIAQPELESGKDYLDVVALLLFESGYLEESLKIRSALLKHYFVKGQSRDFQTGLGDLAGILLRLGQLDEAMDAFKEQESACRATPNLHALQIALSGQGLVLDEQGKLNQALQAHTEHERLCREMEYATGIAISLHNQANTCLRLQDFGRALVLFRQEERLCRERGDLDGLQNSLGGQASATLGSGHLGGVMALHKEQEKVCRELGDRLGVALCIGNQASFLRELGNLNGAMALHAQEERLCREIGNPRGLGVSLLNQGLILKEMGRHQEALAAAQQASQVFRNGGYLLELADSLGNEASLFNDRGDLDTALKLYNEKESIYRQLSRRPELAQCLGNKGMLLNRLGRRNEALVALKEQEQICRELNNPIYIASAIANQAWLFEDSDRIKCVSLLEEAYQLATRCGDVELAGHIKTRLASLTPYTQADPGSPEVPCEWQSFDHPENLFSLRLPPDWKQTRPLSEDAAFAATSENGRALLEIMVAETSGEQGKRGSDVAVRLSNEMVRLLAPSHPDVREIWQGEGGKNSAAVCRRLIVEYTDGVVGAAGRRAAPFTTDHFLIGGDDKLLLSNFKVLSREYQQWLPVLEIIAASISLPGIGHVQVASRVARP